jgi:soluble lytic murein transglycosylase-like protein
MTVRSSNSSSRSASHAAKSHPAKHAPKPKKAHAKKAHTGHTHKSSFHPAPSADVKKWIAQAQVELKKAGVPASKMNAGQIAAMIASESSNDPKAVNNWDSNAKAGHPSMGLMQTIRPTFEQYKLPGHNDITNPVDNIIAGVRYAIDRYGSISNVPGVRKLAAGSAYVGY